MTNSFPGVHPALRPALTRRGFTELTEVQQAVMQEAQAYKNLRISSQTGSGKTVAIGLVLGPPLLARVELDRAPGPQTLIITPTRELAAQVEAELSWLYEDTAITTTVVTGGTSVVREKRLLERRSPVVVGTPGRILDHATSGALDLSGLSSVVLDEADQMLDMGFKEELDAIIDRVPEGALRHLVSATFPRAVERLANRFQPQAQHLEGTQLGAPHGDISHLAHLVRPKEAYDALVNMLLFSHGQKTLVFVRRRVDAKEVSELLMSDGFGALPLSGDLPQAQRTRTLDAFRRGVVNTLVATDVAARGIDVQEIDTVIHFAPPTDAEMYTHRSGRTGRAGRKGRSLLIVTTHERHRVSRVLRHAKVEVTWTPAPSPERITRAITKRTRRRLRAFLETPPELTLAELKYAQGLLDDTEPAELVALMMRFAAPLLPREPADVAEVELEEPSTSRPRKDYVRFFMPWGHRNGATPNRVVAHLCRRGDIKGRAIGAIDIEPRSTTFEVEADLAEAFLDAAQRHRTKEDPPIKPDRKGPRHRGRPRHPPRRNAPPRSRKKRKDRR